MLGSSNDNKLTDGNVTDEKGERLPGYVPYMSYAPYMSYVPYGTGICHIYQGRDRGRISPMLSVNEFVSPAHVFFSFKRRNDQFKMAS